MLSDEQMSSLDVQFPTKWRANGQQGGAWAPTSCWFPKLFPYIHYPLIIQMGWFNHQPDALLPCPDPLCFCHAGCLALVETLWRCRPETVRPGVNGVSGVLDVETRRSGWWFQILFIFTPICGNDPIWRAYFSNGLVQPPTRDDIFLWSWIII